MNGQRARGRRGRPVVAVTRAATLPGAAVTTALAAYTGPAGTFTHLINLCTVLPNLAQGVQYAYHAIARDSNGETAVTDGVFQLRDLAQRPPTQVTPVGTHTVNITAARASGQAMQGENSKTFSTDSAGTAGV